MSPSLGWLLKQASFTESMPEPNILTNDISAGSTIFVTVSMPQKEGQKGQVMALDGTI
jgi:hypothetical protein